MKARSFILLLACMAAGAFLSSCTEAGGSIYYILENEVKQPPSSLGTTTTIESVVKLGSTFYAAAGTIFKSTPDANGKPTWNKATYLLPPQSGALCNTLVNFGGNLYGGFITGGANLGLYKWNGTDFSGTTALTMDAAITPASALQVQKLVVPPSGDRMLVIAAQPYTTSPNTTYWPYLYSLYVTLDGATFTLLLSGSRVSLNDATWDGTKYWAVANADVNTTPAVPPELFSGAANPLAGTFTLSSQLLATDSLQGVYPALGNVYVTSKGTGIYYIPIAGGAWANIPAEVQNGRAVSYFGITGPTVPGSTALLLGCDLYGYYTLTGTTLKRFSGISTALYLSTVLRLVPDAASGYIFACTSGTGLWEGSFDTAGVINEASWTIQ